MCYHDNKTPDTPQTLWVMPLSADNVCGLYNAVIVNSLQKAPGQNGVWMVGHRGAHLCHSHLLPQITPLCNCK
ncbi:hypothetical protein JVT61DRAFT_1512 [Boletus reticuloceps]|uniref:Uncharacterized protein n=1 Tax=Boletus reticuloceps TaxID=495285 RepID=A0A8I3A276_9AGAM|nr:hypothetical protein JVT61DRAFT_1512 [Boletus reticuloceps]